MSLYDALLRVNGGETPVDGSKGVWLKSGAITISSAMKMTGVTVVTPQVVYVYNKGKLNSSILNSTGKGLVYFGGHGVGITVTGSGSLTVSSGGAIYSASFLAAGNGFVSAYGSAYNVSVLQGGQLNVSSAGYLSGGYASATANNGAPLYVRSGASADNVTVDHFGYVIPYGGTITNVTVSSGGRIYTVYAGCGSHVTVLSGGQASAASSGSYYKDVVVESGGSLVISTTASAYDVTLSSGATVTLQSACYVSGISTLGPGFTVNSATVVENLYASVTAYNACTIQHTALVSGAYVKSGDFRFIVYGRLESVYTGPGGLQNRIFVGGVVEDLLNEGTPWSCYNGGSLGRATQLSGNIYIYSGAITTPAAIVISGGSLRPENGGVVSRPTIYDKGWVAPNNSGVVSEALVYSGGSLNMGVSGSAVDCILSSGAAYKPAVNTANSPCFITHLVRKPWVGPSDDANPNVVITYPNSGYVVDAMPPVTSGLILYLDGLNNTGSGFDSEAATWVDRTGNGFDVPINTYFNWKFGGLYLNTQLASGYSLETSQNMFTSATDYTIEIVADTIICASTPQAPVYILGVNGIYFRSYLGSQYISATQNNTSALIVDRTAGGSGTVAAPCAALVASGNTLYGFVEGVLTSSAVLTTVNPPLNQPLRLFNYPTRRAATVYSVRIYNRALTAEEIHQNWLFDRTRYFGARSLDTPVDSQYGVFLRSGTEIVSSAMEMFDTQLTAPYTQQIYNGGLAADGVISGATQTVFSGGTAKRCVVSSGGTLNVSSGGTALAVTSDAGAVVNVLDGGYIEYVTS